MFRVTVPLILALAPAAFGQLPSSSAPGLLPAEAPPGAHHISLDAPGLAALAPGDMVALRLPGYAPLLHIRRVQLAGSSALLSGSIADDPISAFTLAVVGGQVSGTIAGALGNFGLAPTGRTDAHGRAIVEARRLASAVDCAMNRDENLIAPRDHHTRGLLRAAAGNPADPSPRPEPPLLPAGAIPPSGACSCGDDGSTIDVLFLYTTLAKNAAGGAAALQARVNDAVASTNLAYSNSAISVGAGPGRLAARVAGFMEFPYDEIAPNWLDHLSRLADPADGFLDGAIPLRDAARADVVCLIIDDTRFFGGAAFYALYIRDAAAQVLNWRAMGSGSLTYAHELGHTHGCAHDRGNSSFALFPYAWGYSFTAGATTFGTIMSSTGQGIPFFSNPSLTFSGQPIGVSSDQPLPADNARAIREARWTIAAWADSGRITDCNGNGIDDAIDIQSGAATDLNANCRPDSCERRIYVDAGNTGPQDGLSWNTAFTSLAEAMIAASLECNSISEIWIADGVYTPPAPDADPADRFASFHLRSGLALYGSFQGKSRPGGGETALTQRVFTPGSGPAFPAILSGAIGTPADTDNSLTVVVAEDTTPSALLDGLIIERAYSDFDGGGLFVANASPTVRNCILRNCRAGGGAGAAVTGALAHPTFDACTFRDNLTTGSGAGAFVRDGASATFTSCVFRDSSATWGGGAAVSSGSVGTFLDCTFSDNTAQVNSGAIDGFLNASLHLQGCTFLRNRAGVGGNGAGGAMIVHSTSSADLAGCTFDANSAPSIGGAIWVQSSQLQVRDSTFNANASTADAGGAIASFGGSTVTLDHCTLTDNQARSGGACAFANTSFTVSRSTFLRNRATAFSGGAFDLFAATGSSLVSCALAANTAADGGAGLSLGSGCNVTVTNSTITGNTAANSGGGIGMFNSTLTLANSILHANQAGPAQSIQDQQLTRFSGSTTIVNRSCIQTATGAPPTLGGGGVGNIGSNPLFASPLTGDFSLGAGSPCIDAGSNALVAAGSTLDLVGNPRRADDPAAPDTGAGSPPIVDMGAVERQPPPACPADFNMDGNLDPDDLSDYITCFFTQAAFPGACPEADFNNDGNIDPDDLSDYITSFFGSAC